MEVYEKNIGNFTVQIFGKASSNNQASLHQFFAKLKDFQQVYICKVAWKSQYFLKFLEFGIIG